MKEHYIDFKTYVILNLMVLMPDKFQNIIIWESNEIENFDIGFKDFYLVTKEDIETQEWNLAVEPDETVQKMRQKYFVYTEKPEINEKNYKVEFFKSTLVSKPFTLLGGDVDDQTRTYNTAIKEVLRKNNHAI